MIPDVLVTIATNVLSGLQSILPEVSGLPTAFLTASETVFSMLRTLDFILPVDSIFAVALLIIGFEISLLVFRVVMWGIHFIRGN